MNPIRLAASQVLRPQRRFASNGAPFEAAGTGHRGGGWVTTRLGLNTLLFSSGEILLSRARDAIRNTPFGAAAIDSYVANSVGRGIRMVPMHEDHAVREKITAVWNRWCEECDVEYEPRNPGSGQSNFYGIQAIAGREEFEAGEVFVRFRRRPSSDRLTVPLQLELMESEQLPLWRNSPAILMDDKNILRMGIEYRPDGRREAYHFFKAHPYETMFYPLDGLSVERIPSTDILHVYRPLRAGQMRGQPRLAAVLTTLHEIDGYHDAEILRKKTAAMITGFIKKNSPTDQILPENITGVAGQQFVNNDPLSTVSKLEPGTMNVLFPGEDVTFAQPTQDGDFDKVIRVGLRAFAAGAGITYEQLGDLSQLNYSSIRAGLLEFRRKIEQYQRHVFIFQFCQPVYRTWLREAAICGALRLPG
jgi:lambda family phage portal protein